MGRCNTILNPKASIIKSTPEITGKDAKKFLENLEKNDSLLENTEKLNRIKEMFKNIVKKL